MAERKSASQNLEKPAKHGMKKSSPLASKKQSPKTNRSSRSSMDSKKSVVRRPSLTPKSQKRKSPKSDGLKSQYKRRSQPEGGEVRKEEESSANGGKSEHGARPKRSSKADTLPRRPSKSPSDGQKSPAIRLRERRVSNEANAATKVADQSPLDPSPQSKRRSVQRKSNIKPDPDLKDKSSVRAESKASSSVTPGRAGSAKKASSVQKDTPKSVKSWPLRRSRNSLGEASSTSPGMANRQALHATSEKSNKGTAKAPKKRTMTSPLVSVHPNKKLKTDKRGGSQASVSRGGSSANSGTSRSKKTVADHSVFDEDDDDVLYSLVVDPTPPKAKSKRRKSESGPPNEVHPCTPSSSRAPTPTSHISTDSEISFKPQTSAAACAGSSHPPNAVSSGSAAALPDKSPSSYAMKPTTLRSPLSSMDGSTPEIPLDASSETPLLQPGLGPLSAQPEPPASPPGLRFESLMKALLPRVGGKRKGSSLDGCSVEAPEERRLSVRQSESAFKYKEIVVRKAQGFTQVSLDTHTKHKNALNPRVFKELMQVLHAAKFDDSCLVLLTGSGNVFCSGVDLHYVLGDEASNALDKRQCVYEMARGIREFVTALAQFPKPLVAAVNGPAVGLGVALLPLCDVVYASDKATFSCPYRLLGQTPEGGASYTLPQTMGHAVASEVLLAGRRITAMEACQFGLVSQVFWPTSLMQEVVPRVQKMATSSHGSMVLEATKLLLRSHQRGRIEQVVSTECQMLTNMWLSSQCISAIRTYIANDLDL